MQIGQQVWCPRLKKKGLITGQQTDREVVPYWRVRFDMLTLSVKEAELEPWSALKLRQDQLWEELLHLSYEIQHVVEELRVTIAEKDTTRLRNYEPAFDRLMQCQYRLMESHLMQQELED